jgi:hypothetical protein
MFISKYVKIVEVPYSFIPAGLPLYMLDKTLFFTFDKILLLIEIIFVGFWRWCISIKRIVFLDFIHRLVSQEQTKLKI